MSAGWFGAGVSIGGDYVKGEPTYTNADIVINTIDEKTMEKMKTLMGKGAFENLILVMEEGTEYSSTDLTYSGFIRGAGLGVDFLIQGEKIYCLDYNNLADDSGHTFYTNDENFAKTLPPFFEARDGVPLRFVFKDL